jgi:hypothetical protein
MSALPPKAGIGSACWDARFVPKADIRHPFPRAFYEFITGIAGCCARTASGHATAVLPSSAAPTMGLQIQVLNATTIGEIDAVAGIRSRAVSVASCTPRLPKNASLSLSGMTISMQ